MPPEPVKPRRRYDSPRRRQQAEATRQEILDAAQRLFERDGYVPTTMAAVAREAGVAQRTVYVSFETKAGLLRALWHLRLRGDDDPVPMTRRPWYMALLDEPDPASQLAAVARLSREVKERAGALMAVIRAAADADADMAALWATITGEFHGLLRGVVDALDRRKALRQNLDAATAADVLWALAHPDLWQLLVVQRGWSPARYEAWLTAAVTRELIGERPGG